MDLFFASLGDQLEELKGRIRLPFANLLAEPKDFSADWPGLGVNVLANGLVDLRLLPGQLGEDLAQIPGKAQRLRRFKCHIALLVFLQVARLGLECVTSDSNRERPL
jgi:hypothetical protein